MSKESKDTWLSHHLARGLCIDNIWNVGYLVLILRGSTVIEGEL